MLSEFPDGWVATRLGEICSPKQHPTIQKTKFTVEGFPVYGANGHIGFYTDYTHGESTIAITCRGATCGTINVVPPNSYITGNAMALDALDKSVVTFEFLSYYLSKFGVVDCITGSAQPQITRASLLPVELNLPPLKEQQRIAEILVSVDASIQATQAVIDQAERVKRGLMEELLTGGLGSEAIASGEVPKGWEQETVGEIATLNDESLSSRTPVDYEFRYISIDDVKTNVIMGWSLIVFADAPSRARRIARSGDILISTVRPYLKAFACVGQNDKDLVASTGFVVLRAGKRVCGDYLYQLILSDAFVEHLKELMTGSNYPAVKPKDVASFAINLPPILDQHRIAEILSSIDEFIAKQRAIIEQQTRTKKGLMDDLLTGRVRTV